MTASLPTDDAFSHRQQDALPESNPHAAVSFSIPSQHPYYCFQPRCSPTATSCSNSRYTSSTSCNSHLLLHLLRLLRCLCRSAGWTSWWFGERLTAGGRLSALCCYCWGDGKNLPNDVVGYYEATTINAFSPIMSPTRHRPPPSWWRIQADRSEIGLAHCPVAPAAKLDHRPSTRRRRPFGNWIHSKLTSQVLPLFGPFSPRRAETRRISKCWSAWPVFRKLGSLGSPYPAVSGLSTWFSSLWAWGRWFRPAGVKSGFSGQHSIGSACSDPAPTSHSTFSHGHALKQLHSTPMATINLTLIEAQSKSTKISSIMPITLFSRFDPVLLFQYLK